MPDLLSVWPDSDPVVILKTVDTSKVPLIEFLETNSI